MKGDINDVFNDAQSGFIPGRKISNNILLATKLGTIGLTFPLDAC